MTFDIYDLMNFERVYAFKIEVRIKKVKISSYNYKIRNINVVN